MKQQKIKADSKLLGSARLVLVGCNLPEQSIDFTDGVGWVWVDYLTYVPL